MSDEPADEPLLEKQTAPDDEPADEAPEQDVEVSEPQPPATVHILVNRDGGRTAVEVFATGDVRPTEIETIIRLGLNKWQTDAGIS